MHSEIAVNKLAQDGLNHVRIPVGETEVDHVALLVTAAIRPFLTRYAASARLVPPPALARILEGVNDSTTFLAKS